jgi:hypothetical protein
MYTVSVPIEDESAEKGVRWLRVGIAFGEQTNGGIKVQIDALPLPSLDWNGVFYLWPMYEREGGG